ncbi:hypothetical protein [Methyloversatilis discipulorum]|uniref:hypothetical protein n=1 Tax=Methyloversatilis discipulorum TaxID=1119528 RepID=UPI003137A735
MKETPILFSAPMVRAILAGTKTQTRRVVKPQPLGDKPRSAWFEPGVMGWAPPEIPSQAWHRVRCPYGQPGDRLWVREAFSGPHCMDATDECVAVQPSKWGEGSRIWYWADGNPTHGDWTRPRPSIHMPRWASRILLEVTAVRVERLQDISEADAMAEGAECLFSPTCSAADRELLDIPLMEDASPFRNGYALLWESINGAGSWKANPWVWVVEFKRVTP